MRIPKCRFVQDKHRSVRSSGSEQATFDSERRMLFSGQTCRQWPWRFPSDSCWNSSSIPFPHPFRVECYSASLPPKPTLNLTLRPIPLRAETRTGLAQSHLIRPVEMEG